jgi:predicted MFS family arabinose efflux permease
MKGILGVPQICAVSVVFGAAAAFFEPGFTVAVKEMAPPGDRVRANALCAMSRNASGIAGPPLGAVLIGLFGTSGAFFFDALSFAAAALTLAAIPWPPGPAENRKHFPGFKDIEMGISRVRSSTWLWAGILIASVFHAAFTSLMQVALPLYVKEELQGRVSSLGYLTSAMTLGAVMGSLAVGQGRTAGRKGIWLYGSIGAAALGLVAMGLTHSGAAAGGCFLTIGFFIGIAGLVWTVALQDHVDQALLGRVASVDMLGSYALLPAGYCAAALLSRTGGAASVFLWSGFLLAALSLLALCVPGVRDID